MLDVYAHIAVLEVLHERLKRENLAGSAAHPGSIAALDALERAYPFAVLGSIVDHLLSHDGPSDREVSLLLEARTIYDQVRDFLLRLRSVRDTLENVAAAPTAPTALAEYNATLAEVSSLIAAFDPLATTIRSFGWKLQPLRHLPRHPVADDRPVEEWPWRDVLLSRRTGAFASEVLQLARGIGTAEALAFGVGVAANYIGNAIGSPYLVQGVGGPRRSHVYRDRMASYAVGAWIRHAAPLVSADLVRIRYIPKLGSPNAPSLPPWLSALVHKALLGTYPAGSVAAPLPDLNAAYAQLIQHFELLGGFKSFAPPKPISDEMDVRIVNTLQPQDVWRPDNNTAQQPGPAPDGGSGKSIFDPGPNMPPWFLERHEDAFDVIREICLHVLLHPVFLIRVGFWLGHEIGDEEPQQQTGGNPPKKPNLSNPIRLRTQPEFDAIMSGNDILVAIDTLYQLDAGLHCMTERALKAMKVLGLLYPEAKDLPDPTFRQFVVLPPSSLNFTWPARPLANAGLYMRLPASGVEQPPAMPSGFAPGEKPPAFLIKSAGGADTVFDEGYEILRQELLEKSSSHLRNTNLNLDADRGASNACWALPAGASIHDSPVKAVVLGYADV